MPGEGNQLPPGKRKPKSAERPRRPGRVKLAGSFVPSDIELSHPPFESAHELRFWAKPRRRHVI